MPAPVRVAEAAEAAEVEAAEVEAGAAEAAAEVPPSQGRLFAVALPLPVRPSRSAQCLPLHLYLLS